MDSLIVSSLVKINDKVGWKPLFQGCAAEPLRFPGRGAQCLFVSTCNGFAALFSK